MKSRTWLVIGHREDTEEKDRVVGSVGYVNPVSVSQALARAKRGYPGYIIEKVTCNKEL